jgi:hypothetical protein
MIDICIPVLSRPQNAQPVVDSIIRSTTVPHTITFVCSPDDHLQQEAAWMTDQTVLIVDWYPGPADFARKHTYAFGRLEGDWFFAGADDLEFTPGWDTEALAVAERTSASVIGTNDMANPKVMKGQHSTHSLLRRSYIEDTGATWHDGPGVVYSDAYDHQRVDDEMVAAAKMRGVWAFASASVVKHHHPVFDKTVRRDETYEKAMAKGKEDTEVFNRRRSLAFSRPR